MKSLLLTLVALCCALRAEAQQITGRLESSTNKPLAYATIVLLRDGAQAASTTTDSLGRFSLNAPPATYTLQARHLAHHNFEQTLAHTSTTDLGTLHLEAQATTVDAVVITASAVTRQADRFVMSVGDLPSQVGKDGVELLAQAPGVWLDDQGVAINGMKGVKVYVNDREVRLTSERLVAYLRTLTAAEIARIEVIPQASAEYGADTRGGVLRILLRRRRDNGTSTTLGFSTAQSGQLSHYAPTVNVNLRAGRWTFAAAASGGFTPRAQGRVNQTRNYDDQTQQFSDRTTFNRQSRYGSGRMGIFFDPSPRHAFGFEAEYTATRHDTPSEAATEMAQRTTIHSTSHYAQHGREGNLSATFNYRYSVDTLGSALKLLADYTRQRDAGNNTYATRHLINDLTRDTLYRSTTSAHCDIFSAEAALEKQLWRKWKLRSGVKYTHNTLTDDALYAAHTTAGWSDLPAHSYALSYTEQIAAAHLTLSADIGRWGFAAGLRGEYTSTSSHNSNTQRTYAGLFPSLSATYAFTTLRTWMVAAQYSRNIERPSFHTLNPARIQFSDYSYQIGNPSLRPTYINRLSLTLIWKYRYTLTVGGNLHRDLIREVCKIDPTNSDISYITPENHNRENHWFAALSAPVQLTRWLSLSVNAVGVRQEIRATRQSEQFGNYLLFTNATTGITLPAKFYGELTYAYHSCLYSANSEVAPRQTLSVTLKKRLCRDRLTLSLSVANLFDAPESYTSHTSEFSSTTDSFSAQRARHCKIGITWSLRTGRDVKARQAETTSTADRQRLKKMKQNQ